MARPTTSAASILVKCSRSTAAKHKKGGLRPLCRHASIKSGDFFLRIQTELDVATWGIFDHFQR
ncbi:MAG: hypothetical protein PHT48_08820, partial [Dechloromonas sp.]|nr:hypothetical protein [Dechloromonas sp.]